MKLLLDTHILLWFQAGDPALPKATEQAIRSEANEAYCEHGLLLGDRSEAQHREASSSHAARCVLPDHHGCALPDTALGKTAHSAASALPLHHRDPFDRMLIAQAKQEGMHLITVDAQFRAYDVPMIGL